MGMRRHGTLEFGNLGPHVTHIGGCPLKVLKLLVIGNEDQVFDSNFILWDYFIFLLKC